MLYSKGYRESGALPTLWGWLGARFPFSDLYTMPCNRQIITLIRQVINTIR